MSAPRSTPPGIVPTPTGPATVTGPATRVVGYGPQFIRDMGQGLAEIAVWGIAVLVIVGGLGLLGYTLADGVGLAVGVVLAIIVLCVTWLILLVKGASLAIKVFGRH